MKIDLKGMTDEQINAVKNAAKEEKFTSNELLEEIVPLITPYFIAESKICKKSLRLIFPNGQQFTLYVKEEK